MIALYVVLAGVALFAAVLAINTAVQTGKRRKLSDANPPVEGSRAEAYARELQKMIRCRTISSKEGFDDTEFAALRSVMAELFPRVHERAERMIFGDDCWIYRIRGADESRRILLMSHHDVVAAEGEWTHPPFSGELAEGKVWGRGTVDTKTPLFAEFAALEELLAEGFVPPCDVYIGSSHNEELCGDGIPKAVEYFREKGLGFEVVLDEGGAVIDPPIGGMQCEKCAMVAVHEKGRYYLNCTAEEVPGHASLTAAARANPVERMAAFTKELSGGKCFVRRMNPQITAMFRHLAPYCTLPMRVLFSNLWCFGGILKRILPRLSAQAGGLLGTTCSILKIEGSSSEHRCTATAFLRPVDEGDLKADLAAVERIADKYAIGIEVAENSEYHGPADMNHPAFDYTMACIAAMFPRYPAAPFILPAGSDARTLTAVCPCVLRFAPILLSARQLASVHGVDENIDQDAVARAVMFYKYFLQNYP